MISNTSRTAVLLLMLLSQAILIEAQDTSDLRSASLRDRENKPAHLSLPDKIPAAILILGTDCPITQKYIPTLETLYRSFNRRVAFIGVFPNQYTAADVAAFVDEYRISFPCYVDHKMEVVGILDAAVTPEAFLINPEWDVVYAGAIDNWFYKLGSYRAKVTKHYLNDAINSLLAGDRIVLRRTDAIGCPVPQSDHDTKAPSHSHH